MIPESFKQDLLNRVDIVDVVSRYVQLKKGGANYLGLCPFHGEKTPSFTVSPAKQFYHCFGCGAHGNAIGFQMEYGGMGYIDAIKELAASVGMQVPESRPRTPEEASGFARKAIGYDTSRAEGAWRRRLEIIGGPANFGPVADYLIENTATRALDNDIPYDYDVRVAFLKVGS